MCSGDVHGDRGWYLECRVVRWGGGRAVGGRGVGGAAALGRGRRVRRAGGVWPKSARVFVDSALPERAVRSSVRASVFPNRALHGGMCVFCVWVREKITITPPIKSGEPRRPPLGSKLAPHTP